MEIFDEVYGAQYLKSYTVGIIGGTGPQGSGIGYRFAQAGFQVILGSRNKERAFDVANNLGNGISGASNQVCAEKADILVIAIPWESHNEILEELMPALNKKIIINCVNPMGFDKEGAFSIPTKHGSACQEAQNILKESWVVSAFNHVSADLLLDMNLVEIEMDVLVVGDHKDSTNLVQNLINELPGMRGIYAGKMRNAGQIEAFTANLISVNRRYKTHSGIRIVGI